MKTVLRFAIGAVSVLCLAAQTPPAKTAPPDEQQKNDKPQTLPPGPLGLQPLINSPSKADGKAGSDPNAADPNKMAAPSGSKSQKPASAPVDSKTYVMGAEDVLRILVWNQQNLSGEFVVRPDGKISLPLVGDVMASDKTPEQLASDIEQKLKDGKFLLDPNVTVQVFQVHSKKYFIEGEVNHPGAYDLVVPTTIMQGLVNAGGFRDFANKKNIVILRDGGRIVKHFNYNDVSRGKHIEQNILLQPNDHIIIH